MRFYITYNFGFEPTDHTTDDGDTYVRLLKVIELSECLLGCFDPYIYLRNKRSIFNQEYGEMDQLSYKLRK